MSQGRANKTIQVDLKFFTNGFDDGPVAKNCIEKGSIGLPVNPLHGIGRSRCVMFNSIDEIPNKLREIFRREGISHVRTRRKAATVPDARRVRRA